MKDAVDAQAEEEVIKEMLHTFCLPLHRTYTQPKRDGGKVLRVWCQDCGADVEWDRDLSGWVVRP